MRNFPATFLLLVVAPAAAAQGLSDLVNYREYSPTFASAGQPSEEQLTAIRDAGFERIIYLAYSDQPKSLPNEDRLVKNLGLEYVHIPVEWNSPTKSDFYLFASAMRTTPEKKTLLHCQVNYRASAFSFLYRVIDGNVPVAEAKADMNTVWTPNQTWRDLIFEVLEDNGVSPDCAGCDWTPAPDN